VWLSRRIRFPVMRLSFCLVDVEVTIRQDYRQTQNLPIAAWQLSCDTHNYHPTTPIHTIKSCAISSPYPITLSYKAFLRNADWLWCRRGCREQPLHESPGSHAGGGLQTPPKVRLRDALHPPNHVDSNKSEKRIFFAVSYPTIPPLEIKKIHYIGVVE
jgi:hypothetical protein